MNTLLVVLMSVVLIGLAVTGIAIKVLFQKNGKFAGSCSSNNPMLTKEGLECPVCGAKPEELCKKPITAPV